MLSKGLGLVNQFYVLLKLHLAQFKIYCKIDFNTRFMDFKNSYFDTLHDF